MLDGPKALILLTLGVALLRPVSGGETKQPCKGNAYQVAPCFRVRGRLMIHPGSPSARIWHIGTARILGVSERYPQIRSVPESLEQELKPETVIYGDFDVCPFTRDRPGEMQLVCIESASHLRIKKMQDP